MLSNRSKKICLEEAAKRAKSAKEKIGMLYKEINNAMKKRSGCEVSISAKTEVQGINEGSPYGYRKKGGLSTRRKNTVMERNGNRKETKSKKRKGYEASKYKVVQPFGLRKSQDCGKQKIFGFGGFAEDPKHDSSPSFAPLPEKTQGWQRLEKTFVRGNEKPSKAGKKYMSKKKESGKGSKIYAFGGYSEPPKNDSRLHLMMPSINKVPGWRTLERCLERESKRLVQEIETKKNNFPKKRNAICQNKERSFQFSQHSLQLPTCKDYSQNSFLAVQPLVSQMNASGNLCGRGRALTMTMGEKIEALLENLVRERKKLAIKNRPIHLTGLMPARSSRQRCPAKCEANQILNSNDSEEKWSTPRPAMCTCFPRAHSAEALVNVLSETCSISNVSSNRYLLFK